MTDRRPIEVAFVAPVVEAAKVGGGGKPGGGGKRPTGDGGNTGGGGKGPRIKLNALRSRR